VTSLAEISALDLKLMLTDETPDSPPCDGLDDDGCGPPALEAVARAVWDGSCAHVGETLLCVQHRDELQADVDSGRQIMCSACRKYVRVRIEPLR
jgi:hypothetical protein